MKRQVELPYGGGTQRFSIDEERLSAVVLPRGGAPAGRGSVIPDALEAPVDAPEISEFLAPGRKVLVIVNDGTRPTPTPAVLEAIWPLLKATNFRFMVACGTHKAPTPQERPRIFGTLLPEAERRIAVHDANAKDLVSVGESERGNHFRINKAFDEYERVLVIGSVEPHYFAGFTGGRKGFLPGIAAYDTIERNHRNALDPASQILRLDGNPVHDEMAEMEAVLKARKPDGIYTIQSIAAGGTVRHAACGDITKAFRSLIPAALETFCSPIPRKTDLVVSAAVAPGDASLYQAQKAIEHAKPALAKGGTAVLVAKCQDGIGPSSFFDLLTSAPTPEGVMEKIGQGYKLGYHKAAKLVELVVAGGAVRIVSSIQREALGRGFMKGHASVQEAVDAALADGCESCTVMPEGSNTVPVAGNK
ncbi:MAG: nickel-dependent lactate racemase [Methanobacteriota archaeon]